MGKFKQLQADYKAGKITKADYQAKLKELLDGDFIDQEMYDEALTLDPEADKPQYTQADVDRIVAVRANKMVRKALKDAGVEVDAENKDLLPKVVELVKIGAGKAQPAQGAEVEALKMKAAKADTTIVENRRLKVENALLKTVGKYEPVSTQAVVTLLTSGTYSSLLEMEDESDLDPAAINKAVKKLQADEPGLFKVKQDDEDGAGGPGTEQNGGEFRGKGPGGGTSGGSSKDKDFAKKLEEAKGMITTIPKTQTTK